MSKLAEHPILPPREIQRLRNPSELLDWFSSKETELDVYLDEKQSTITDDEEFFDKHLWHQNTRFFWLEICPIAHCARARLFSEGACMSISTEYQSYDATVEDNLNGGKTFIEATSTVDGQDEKISFLHRRLYGRSPAFQKIKYDGTKNTSYKIPNSYNSGDKPIATGVDEIFEKLWEKISKRIRAKETKNYPIGT